MRKGRVQAAVDVADQLFKAEEAVDGALSGASRLTATMCQARHDANLAATVGQDAIEEVAAAVAAIAKARGHIVSAHRALDATKDRIGLRTMNFGTGAGKENQEVGSLRVVESDAA